MRTGCQWTDNLCYRENLNWAAQNLVLGCMQHSGRGLKMAGLGVCVII